MSSENIQSVCAVNGLEGGTAIFTDNVGARLLMIYWSRDFQSFECASHGKARPNLSHSRDFRSLTITCARWLLLPRSAAVARCVFMIAVSLLILFRSQHSHTKSHCLSVGKSMKYGIAILCLRFEGEFNRKRFPSLQLTLFHTWLETNLEIFFFHQNKYMSKACCRLCLLQ